MSNMSYCRYQNTSSDFQDCIDAIDTDGLQGLSSTELSKAQEMRNQAEAYIDLYDQAEEDIE